MKAPDVSYTMYKYRISFWHDTGRSSLILFAGNIEQAIYMFCKAELAPEGAILNIKCFTKS